MEIVNFSAFVLMSVAMIPYGIRPIATAF